MSLEENIKAKSHSSGKHDPAATDLDYYSKPENYEGSTLQSFKRFQAAKDKEEKSKQVTKKEKKVKDAKYYFFNRYKHILQDVIFISDLLEREKEESSESEEEEEEKTPSSPSKQKKGKSGTPTVAMDIIAEEVEDEEEGSSAKPDASKLDVDRSLSQKSRSSVRSVEILSSSKSGMGYDSDERSSSQSPDSMGHGYRGKKMSTSVGRQSTAIQRVKMDQMAREIRGKELKEMFRKAGIGIKCICRLAASARGKQATAGGSMRTFMDIANDESTTEENMKNQGLSFDPSYFKAKKEISLSTETKNILTTPSELRTPEQVQTAMFGLQSLRSYAEYPLHMQEKLAKVAWYEVVAPKRIIIRQGHVAENFYFVLSGHAVVTILLRNPQTGASFVKTATVMKKGMSFGELALLHHSKRTATVTSQDQVQLLSIGREDFFDIFMAGQGEDNLPDHVRFISNLEFMKDWPIELLVEHPEHCLLHFYKRNTTIVGDSNKSEWMYIVKSGSCQVLKKLKGVTAKCVSKRKKDDDLNLPPKTKCIVFEPKVDTGLRKKRKNNEKDKEEEEQKSEVKTEKTETDAKFSKEEYSKKPPTKKVYFSIDNSSFAKRKQYDPPEKSKPKKQEEPKEPPAPAKPGPVFVQVSNMKPRDVFGLDTVEFDDDIQRSNTSVSLISRGAECVMLSKAFFAKHANEAVKKHVRHMVRPYPDEDVFQENFQIKEDWNLFKKVLLNDVTSQMKDEAELYKNLV